MNVVQGVKQYITRMTTESGAGMKVLLMDKETISIVSMVYSQSEILQKEVYLFELISNTGRETMRHLNAICFLRPTQENVDLLSDELKSPKYSSYFVYFSNTLNSRDLRRLAEADEQESVREIKEFYGDYIAVAQHLFSFNIEACCEPGGTVWRRELFYRTSDGLKSVLLALRKRPIIRYSAASQLTLRLAEQLQQMIDQDRELFSFGSDVPPILLLLDRRDDPITPLLNQDGIVMKMKLVVLLQQNTDYAWSYQAMVHEILGIRNHRVDLSQAPGIKKDLHEVVLSPEQDEFFRDNMYLNFGEIGANIKELVDHYQQTSKSHAKIESIADMKAFIENYPQFRKLSGTVSKHVAVVSELSRLVSNHCIMAVSETEQDIVTGSDRSGVMRNLEGHCGNDAVRPVDCLRLGLLFVLRYEGQDTRGDVQRIDRLLQSKGVSDRERKLLQAVVEYGGKSKRTGELFAGSSALSITKKFFKGLKGVENVYTRHKPQLADTLDALVKGKLKDRDFPFAGRAQFTERPQDVIVFVVGGATFEEALTVANFNKTMQGVRVILGGTTIHNSSSFLSEVEASTHTLASHRARGRTAT